MPLISPVKLIKKEELDDREAEWGGYHHHLLMDGHLIIHMEVYVDSLLCLIHHVVFFLKEDIIEVEVAVKLTKKNTREEWVGDHLHRIIHILLIGIIRHIVFFLNIGVEVAVNITKENKKEVLLVGMVLLEVHQDLVGGVILEHGLV
jgi:hypothetical protein